MGDGPWMMASSGRLSRSRLRVRLFRAVEEGFRRPQEAKGESGRDDGLSEARDEVGEREEVELVEERKSSGESRERLRLRAIVVCSVEGPRKSLRAGGVGIWRPSCVGW